MFKWSSKTASEEVSKPSTLDKVHHGDNGRGYFNLKHRRKVPMLKDNTLIDSKESRAGIITDDNGTYVKACLSGHELLEIAQDMQANGNLDKTFKLSFEMFQNTSDKKFESVPNHKQVKDGVLWLGKATYTYGDTYNG